MKSYSVELREKIVAEHLQKNISIRKVANIFSVSKSLVQKLVKQQKLEGNLQSKRKLEKNNPAVLWRILVGDAITFSAKKNKSTVKQDPPTPTNNLQNTVDLLISALP